MTFSDIIGQEAVKEQLREQIMSNRVPHAQLFYGPEGTGKMAAALTFAQALLCQHPENGEPCGDCQQCRMAAKLQHPDLHFVFPVLQSKQVSDAFLQQWREMLLESPYFDRQTWFARLGVSTQQPHIYVSESEQILRKISLASQQGGYKVMIIYLPELMMPQAANKLLKILEEPTPRTAFLLVSDNPEQLLTTIVSRTQRVAFSPLSVEQLSEALQQRNLLQPDDALRVARAAVGNYVRALRQIHIDEESATFFDLFVLFMRLCYMRRIKDLQSWSEKIAGWGREKQKNFLDYMLRMVRENFVYNFREPRLNYMSQTEADFAKNFARFINERNVVDIATEIEACQRDIAQNANARIVFFDFSLKMIMLLLK